MRRLSPAALIATLAALAAGCTDGATSPRLAGVEPASAGVANANRKRLNVDIDGVIGRNEWRNATSLAFMANAPEGMVPAELLVQADAQNVYLAVRIQRASVATEERWLDFEFDNDYDGVAFENDDDVLFVGGLVGSSAFTDEHRYIQPNGGGYTDIDGTQNGAGAVGGDATTMVYELSHPLNSGDPQDFAVGASNPTVGMYFDIRMPIAQGYFDNGPNALTQVASFAGYCKLQLYATVALPSCPSGQVAIVRVTPPSSSVLAPASVASGSSIQLGLAVYDYLGNSVPGASCTWQSTNTSAATVSASGQVTGVAAGTAIVVAACNTLGSFGSQGQITINVT